MSGQIPGPRAYPVVGNLFNVDFEMPLRGAERLADEYGPIYQLTLKGKRQLVCSSAAMMAELVDEKKFVKIPPEAIDSSAGPRGLFSARNEDPDWAQAHRILMPSFAPLSVQDMFPGALSNRLHDLHHANRARHERYRQSARVKLGPERTRECDIGY